MKPAIARQLWTRVTPWRVCVSPLDDPNMPLVAECSTSAEAERVVREHNAMLASVDERGQEVQP